MATLKDRYRSEIAPKLKEELGLTNVMEVPRVTKITLNMGVGEAVGDKKVLEKKRSFGSRHEMKRSYVRCCDDFSRDSPFVVTRCDGTHSDM